MYNQTSFTLPWAEKLPSKKEAQLQAWQSLQVITWTEKKPSGGMRQRLSCLVTVNKLLSMVMVASCSGADFLVHISSTLYKVHNE